MAHASIRIVSNWLEHQSDIFFLEKLTKKIKYDDNVSFDSTDYYSGEISKLVSPEIVCDLNHWLEVGCQ